MSPADDTLSTTWRQSLRFLLVGGTTVLLDLAVYGSLLWSGIAVSPAKAAGFVAGTLFAYVANWLFTFGGAAGGGRTMMRFAAVYTVNLGVNVAANALVLLVLGTSRAALIAAFLVATGLSATLNFLGMKHWVFTTPARRSAP